MIRYCTFIFLLSLIFQSVSNAQDVILQGCYWSCPEDDPNEAIDSASLIYWTERMQEQAPELAHAGFTYLWLPPLQDAAPQVLGPFFKALANEGITPLASIYMKRDSSFLDKARQLKKDYDIRAFSLHQIVPASAPTIAMAINQMNVSGETHELLVADLGLNTGIEQQSRWVSTTTNALDFEVELEAQPRVYDFPLREALRRASTDVNYDVRNVFERSMRDASSLSGFNLVTLINHPTFKNQNGKAGDRDDPLDAPLLAYAYLLTNNQIGLPAVFYGDYYGDQSEVEGYDKATPLYESINQLIQTHKEFIYGSTNIEYLNQKGSTKRSVYFPGGNRADSTQVLIFQLDGTSTPAGQINTPPGNKDIIVAINFSKDTLDLIQEINMAHVSPEDYFSDIIGNALQGTSKLIALDSSTSERNALALGLSPRSYSVWVQGRAVEVAPSRVALETHSFPNYIEVSWESAYETNLLGYELERSVNGSAYELITSLKALSGTSDPASYVFLDKDIFPGEQLYYRIKALDKNGGYEYSPVENTTFFKRKLSFELMDNTSQTQKILHINSNQNANAIIKLINTRGEQVFTQQLSIKEGASKTIIPFDQFEKGIYFLHFKIGQKLLWSKRVVWF